MHILLRERHGLEETAAAEDLGQAAADLVVLSFSDSDLSAFAAAWRGGRETLPSLRLANLRRLAHPLSVDLYIEKTLSGARGILIALIGCVFGSIAYRLAIQLALSSDVLGLKASDLNFVTAVLVAIALILPRLRRGGATS